MRKKLIFLATLVGATSAIAQTAPTGDEDLSGTRARFDVLYKQLTPALDDAIAKLEAVPAKSSGPEWVAAKLAVARENAILLPLATMLRDVADQARAHSQPGDVDNPYLEESLRESRLIVPMAQREVVLAHLLIAKRPPPEQGRPTRLPGGGTVTFNPADYPPLAMRMNHEGTTSFRLVFGAEGRATNCTVTMSSGYAELDDTTCRLMTARARFPAGRTGSYVGSVNWRIPQSHAPATIAPSYAAQEAPLETTPAYELGKAEAVAAMGGNPDR